MAQERVTVLVFKDNYASRTFQIPLAWLTRFGTVIGTLFALTLGTTYFAVKYYRVARQTDPLRVQDLENELADMKSTYKTLELKAATSATAPALPVPHVTVTVTATPAGNPAETHAPAAPVATEPHPTPMLFAALPAKILAPPADVGSLPIQVSSPKVFWQGKTLRVGFDIQYVRNDKGNQQGRIIILARGPETLLAYPDGVLNGTGAESLIAPDQGEYFSVSRFREVRAEFGPVRSPEILKEVEILLVNNGQILLHQILTPTSAPVRKVERPATPPATEENTQPIGPGYDQ